MMPFESIKNTAVGIHFPELKQNSSYQQLLHILTL